MKTRPQIKAQKENIENRNGFLHGTCIIMFFSLTLMKTSEGSG